MTAGTAGRPSVLSSGAVQPALPSGLCSLHLSAHSLGRNYWRWFQSQGNCSSHWSLRQAHTAGSTAWFTLHSWGAWVHGKSQKQHAGDTLWSSNITVCSCLLPRLYHSSILQSLGSPLATIGKAVLMHWNTITKHNHYKKLWIFRS